MNSSKTYYHHNRSNHEELFSFRIDDPHDFAFRSSLCIHMPFHQASKSCKHKLHLQLEFPWRTIWFALKVHMGVHHGPHTDCSTPFDLHNHSSQLQYFLPQPHDPHGFTLRSILCILQTPLSSDSFYKHKPHLQC